MIQKLLYQGKAKAIYEIEGSQNNVLQVFQDSITAFNNPEKFFFEKKGLISCQISTKIFEYLEKNGIKTHLISSENDSQIVQKLTILPIEVTVRNYAFGASLKRSHFSKGEKLSIPLVEFMYKKDEFGDPLISEDYVIKYLLKNDKKLFDEIKSTTETINQLLIEFFDKIDLTLCDFKIEFGLNNKNELLLGDEICGDTCRLIDKKTGASLDKDIFRNKTGDVMDGYREILKRIKEKYN
jgi:phosphoribosylaminoimidazole-succinocarboxamide synthase